MALLTDTSASADSPTAQGRKGGRRRRRFPLLQFVIGRLATGLLTLLVVSLLVFFATKILPGDVAQTVLGRNATPDNVAHLRDRLHLDRPLLAQYFDWLTGLLRGDLGQSAVAVAQNSADTSIWHLVSAPLQNSAVLAGAAAVLLLPLAIVLGGLAGAYAGKGGDFAISYSALIVGSLPEFVLGTFLILVFFTELRVLPPVALIPPGGSPFDHVSFLALPIMTLLGVSLALCLRQVRAGVAETLRQDYVTAARLGGVKERRVIFRYALRNALAPSVQAYAQTIQYLFGGIVVVEVLFTYPGIGNLLVQAVQTRDTALVAAIAMLIAAFFIVVNIVADMAVIGLVPKLRTGAFDG